MGIRCLTKFVNERFTRWKKGQVEGELIVDGCSLCYEFMRAGADSMFGGDYMTLAREIDNFLTTLLRCKIKPFLIFDGTIDDKKVNTIAARTQDKLETAVAVATETCPSTRDTTDGHVSSRTFSSNNNDCILDPLLASYVMIDTVRRVLGEEHLFVADGDADIDIASLAIHHRCPVLSNDSDFYIFPLQYGYIPFSKFQWNDSGNDAIYAESYFYELFCEQFGFHDSSLLAVIPAIIGNDMMPPLDVQDRNKLLPPDPACKSPIERAVIFAASFTTLEACIHTLQQQELIDPADVIENVQEAYNDYFFVPCKFCKPLDILKTTLECADDSPMPEFVLQKFRVGVYSTFLIRILRDQELYKVMLEDISETWCRLNGVPVRRAIYGILCGKDAFITEYQRGENPLVYDKIEIKSVVNVTYNGRNIPLPSLQSCGLGIEKEYGREVLFGVLNVKEEDFKKIPIQCHLLLAVTHFWYKCCTISKKDALLKAFLLNLQKPLMLLSTNASVREDGKLQGRKGSTKALSDPIFPISSFTHAFAQWQSLYHDIYNLNRLLQEPLTLLPVSDFLECSYLHRLVEVVLEEGIKNVIRQNRLDRNMYLNFLCATVDESIEYW